MKDKIKEEIKALEQQAEELSNLREDVFNVKSDMTITAVGILLKKLDAGIEDLLVTTQEKDNYYDKDLCKTLKETTKELVDAFSKIQPPKVTVNSPVNIDLKPIQSIANDISKGQNDILTLLNKLNNGDKSGELYRLITAMIGRQDAIIEKAFQVVNYSPELKSIAEAINKKNSYVGEITQRNGNGFIHTFEIKPK